MLSKNVISQNEYDNELILLSKQVRLSKIKNFIGKSKRRFGGYYSKI